MKVPDTWTQYQRIEGKSIIWSAEKKVRAGRDSAERLKRFYPNKSEYRKAVKVSAGDRMKFAGELWDVLSVSDGTEIYIDIKALQG